MQMNSRSYFTTAICAAVLSFCAAAADRTISSDYTLIEDEVVDGILTVDAGVTVDLAGHKLTVKGLAGDGTITSSKYMLDGTAAAPEFVAGEALIWLDASDSSTLTLDGASVTRWASKVGGNAAQYLVNGSTNPDFNDSTYGIPTVDFGELGGTKDLAINAINNARTVFLALKIDDSPNAFLLCDCNGGSIHFHRGEQGQYAATYGGVNMDRVWNGLNEASVLNDKPIPDAFNVIAVQMKSASYFNSLTFDRGITVRRGGKQLSELICFNRVLSDEERIAVTTYLQKKWINTAELHVATDAAVENSTVAIKGALRLVVEGGGSFTASKADQSYIGGTTVAENTSLTLGTAANPLGPGNATQTVTMGEGARFFAGGNANNTTCTYNFTLGAGSAMTFGHNGSRELRHFASIVLNGNASITVQGGTGITGLSESLYSTIRLNGNTLSISATESPDSLSRFIKSLDAGTIRFEVVEGNGIQNHGGATDFSSARVEYAETAYVHLGNRGLSVGDFEYLSSKWRTFGAGMSVYGRYKAGALHPPMTMQSGSTLDLSGVSDVWTADGIVPSDTGHANMTSSGRVTFLSSGAAYTVDVGTRDVAVGQQLIEFDPTFDPDDSVTFALIATGATQTPEERQIGLKIKRTGDGYGLFVKSLLAPQVARWDLNATPAGWKFYRADGTEYPDEWTDGVTEEMTVRFSSYAEHAAIKTQAVNPMAYVLEGTVSLDGGVGSWDLTSCFDYMADGSTIDLAGKSLTVSSLRGNGTITSSKYALDDAVAAPAFVADEAIFWLDASAGDTIAVDGNGAVTSWASRVGGNSATAQGSTAPLLDNSTYGIPTVDFGATGSGKDMNIATRLTNIRTAFWVLKIEKNKDAFWLGDTIAYAFHRCQGGGQDGAYAADYSNFSRMWNGTQQVGLQNDYPAAERFLIVAGEMKGDSCSNRLTQDRNIGGRNGGRQLSELICFSRVLSDVERVAVTKYLQRKWFGKMAELHVVANESVANGAVAFTGAMRLVVEGGGTFTASKVDQSYFGGTVVADNTTLALGTYSNPLGVGDATQTVTLGEGAAFSAGGNASDTTCTYNFELGEGSSLTFAPSGGYSTRHFGALSLNGNASLNLHGVCGMVGLPSSRSTIMLNGNVLSVFVASGSDSHMKYVKTLDGGTVRFAGGGNMQGMEEADLSSADVEYVGDAWTHLGNDGFSVGGFRYDSSTQFWKSYGAYPVKVFGKYTAGEFRPPLEIQNGATFDLSEVEGSWSVDGQPAVRAPSTNQTTQGLVSFADGAEVFVEIGDRKDVLSLAHSGNPYLVSWSAKPNATFVIDPELYKKGFRLEAEDSGLKFCFIGGTVIFIK